MTYSIGLGQNNAIHKTQETIDCLVYIVESAAFRHYHSHSNLLPASDKHNCVISLLRLSARRRWLRWVRTARANLLQVVRNGSQQQSITQYILSTVRSHLKPATGLPSNMLALRCTSWSRQERDLVLYQVHVYRIKNFRSSSWRWGLCWMMLNASSEPRTVGVLETKPSTLLRRWLVCNNDLNVLRSEQRDRQCLQLRWLLLWMYADYVQSAWFMSSWDFAFPINWECDWILTTTPLPYSEYLLSDDDMVLCFNLRRWVTLMESQMLFSSSSSSVSSLSSSL